MIDGIDQNCDGVDGMDMDGDGYASQVSGGDDCDDSNSIYNKIVHLGRCDHHRDTTKHRRTYMKPTQRIQMVMCSAIPIVGYPMVSTSPPKIPLLQGV